MSDTAAQPTAVPEAPASLPAQDAASAEPVASVQQGTPELAQGRPADAAVSPSAAEQRLPVRTYLEQNGGSEAAHLLPSSGLEHSEELMQQMWAASVGSTSQPGAACSWEDINCAPARPSWFAVVPILMQAMMELNRKRPADPIDFLCTYLQQHKTQRISDKN